MITHARIAGVLVGLALLAIFLAVPAIPLTIAPAERVTNGQFENGFDRDGVGRGWQSFDSGGRAEYVWQDEVWEPALWDGSHGQLIAIRISDGPAPDADHLAGIYQTIAVTAGETYQFSFHGALRALTDSRPAEGNDCRVQWGVDHAGGSDARAVEDWVDVPWFRLTGPEDPVLMDTYETSITAGGDRFTLFLRLRRAWNATTSHCRLNLDGISLRQGRLAIEAADAPVDGPVVTLVAPAYVAAGEPALLQLTCTDPTGIAAVILYDDGAEVDRIVYGGDILSAQAEFEWLPADAGPHLLRAEVISVAGRVGLASQSVAIGAQGEHIINGGFEEGFGADGVAAGWRRFYTGSPVGYGWSEGIEVPTAGRTARSQRITVSTADWIDAAQSRYAGVYQRVVGLRVGATYRLRIQGHLGASGSGANPLAADLQYGIDWSAGSDPGRVNAWRDLPLSRFDGEAGVGIYHDFTETLVAPASSMTLYIRLKRPLDEASGEIALSLDDVNLTGYQ